MALKGSELTCKTFPTPVWKQLLKLEILSVVTLVTE